MNNDSNIAITLLANAIGQQAARPQKHSVYTQTTTTPYARPDMIMRRDTIGPSRQNLVDTLRKREDAGYSIANTLASMPQQQGYGTWLGDFARAFGGTLKAPTDAQIVRAQADYDAEQKDLAMALDYDKAMGGTQTQVQNIGYDDVAGGSKSGGGIATLGGIPVENVARSRGYDPVKDRPRSGPIARLAATGDSVGLGDWLKIPGTNALAKGIAGKSSADLQMLWGDIADNILSGKVLDFVGKAGSVRVADSNAEKETIFGPLQGYRDMSDEQLDQNIDRSRNAFVALGLKKAKEQNVPVTKEELKEYYNSAFTVPRGAKVGQNIQDIPDAVDSKTPVSPNQSTERGSLIVGEVRNGVRFLGYDEDGKMRFEKVQ